MDVSEKGHAMGVPEEAEDDSVELARREAERPSAMVLPRKRQVHVEIVSCGVGNLVFTLAHASGKNRLHGSLYTRCRKLRTAACEHGNRNIDREEVASILRDAGIFSRTRFYFVSDARLFHNPEHNTELRDHIGYHPEIVHMLATAKPQLLIANVKDQVRRASMSGVEKPEVGLVTFCKSGNRRAVAMAWMIQQALSHSRKVCSVQTFHVTEEAGDWDTRQCGPCDICWGQAIRLDKKHEKMLNEAREIAEKAWARDNLPILP